MLSLFKKGKQTGKIGPKTTFWKSKGWEMGGCFLFFLWCHALKTKHGQPNALLDEKLQQTQGYQCQRHEQYNRQWRAAEVRNCKVDRSTSLSMARAAPISLIELCRLFQRGSYPFHFLFFQGSLSFLFEGSLSFLSASFLGAVWKNADPFRLFFADLVL